MAKFVATFSKLYEDDIWAFDMVVERDDLEEAWNRAMTFRFDHNRNETGQPCVFVAHILPASKFVTEPDGFINSEQRW